MRFSRRKRLDPSQVEDSPRRRVGCRFPEAGSPSAAAGSALGGLVIFLLITLLNNGGGRSARCRTSTTARSRRAVADGVRATARAARPPTSASRLPHRRLREQHPGLLDGRVPARRPTLHAELEDRLLHRPDRAPPAAIATSGRSARSTARVDKLVYLDLGFFDELRDRGSARNGRTVRPGVRARARVRPSRPGPARALERRLGRDRCAGRLGPDRAPGRLLAPASGRTTPRDRLSSTASPQDDIADGLDAAAAVGDDRIQAGDAGPGQPRDAGRTASSSQRQHWFTVGYQRRRPERPATRAAALVLDPVSGQVSQKASPA